MDTSLYGKGGVRDSVDIRDFQYHDVARAALPFDWGMGFDIEKKVGAIPTKDQGPSNSCGGQAWSYYMAVIEALATGSFENRSAKYIYANTFVPGGGSAGRTNCDFCINYGDSFESFCSSYENGQPPSEAFITRVSDITVEAYANGKLSRALSYSQVVSNIDLFAQALRDNGGLVLGIDGEDNGTWRTAFPKPPTTAVWAHWLYVGKAKMINGKKFIGIKNSWGDLTGEQGWQWIGEDYFNSGHVWYGWTLVFKPIENGIYKFTRDMKYGDRTEDVRQLQIRFGFTKEYQTGFYGPMTSKAVLDYQINKGIPLSFYERWILAGRSCGPKTRAELNK